MTGKKLLVVFLTVMAILASAVLPVITGCAEPAPTTPTPATPSEPAPTPAETIELKWLLTDQGYDPANWGWKSVMGGGWAGEVERLSNGRVKFTYLTGAVTHQGMFDSLVARAGDIANSVTLLNSGRWPVVEILTIPDFFTVCQRPSKVAWELWQEFPEINEEFYEVKLLGIYATTPSPPGIGFATKDKRISTLEDMKGVKMGSYGEWATKAVGALGFTTVAVPVFEIYESMQRGVVDGSCMDVDQLTAQNVGEVAKYWVAFCLQFCPFWFGMNWDTWNSLPPDIQKLMEDVAPMIPDAADRYLKEDQNAAIAAYPEVEDVQIAPEEQARWRERQDPVQEEYLAQLEAKGIDAHKIHEEMTRLFQQYAEALP